MWTKKTKTLSSFERTRILTHDGKQILVGNSENMVLISQEKATKWGYKTKS
jgi:hypothetical protein